MPRGRQIDSSTAVASAKNRFRGCLRFIPSSEWHFQLSWASQTGSKTLQIGVQIEGHGRIVLGVDTLVQAGLATCLFHASAISMPCQKVQPLCSETPIFHFWRLFCFLCFTYESKRVHSFKTELQSLFFYQNCASESGYDQSFQNYCHNGRPGSLFPSPNRSEIHPPWPAQLLARVFFHFL